MFCPRCGRPVSDIANFCGGCGLPKAEIERYNANIQQQMQSPAVQPAPAIEPVDVNELNSTINMLEKELTEDSAVTNYTTEHTEDTNNIGDVITPSDFVRQELAAEQKKAEEMKAAATYEQTNYTQQSAYSYSAPKAPEYSTWSSSQTPAQEELPQTSENLSTVDFLWMMILGGIPVFGLFYMIYLGFVQDENSNKRSYARANLIIAVFSFVLSMVFMVGILMSNFMM